MLNVGVMFTLQRGTSKGTYAYTHTHAHTTHTHTHTHTPTHTHTHTHTHRAHTHTRAYGLSGDVRAGKGELKDKVSEIVELKKKLAPAEKEGVCVCVRERVRERESRKLAAQLPCCPAQVPRPLVSGQLAAQLPCCLAQSLLVRGQFFLEELSCNKQTLRRSPLLGVSSAPAWGPRVLLNFPFLGVSSAPAWGPGGLLCVHSTLPSSFLLFWGSPLLLLLPL